MFILFNHYHSFRHPPANYPEFYIVKMQVTEDEPMSFLKFRAVHYKLFSPAAPIDLALPSAPSGNWPSPPKTTESA